MDQLEIMAVGFYCNFQKAADNPEIIINCQGVKSSCFSETKVLESFESLEKSIENLIERNCGKNQEKFFREKRFWNIFHKFSKKLSGFIVCVTPECRLNIQDEDGKSFLIVIAQLDKNSTEKYGTIVKYVLDEMTAALETINAIPAFLHSDFFTRKMENRQVLFGNYVERFLEKRNLPKAEVLIELSSEKYEGSESEARIYIEGTQIVNVAVLDKLGEESRIICSENRRMIRKLMEISKTGYIHLLAERKETGEWCISKLVNVNEEKTGLYIKFFGYLCWGIVCDGKEVIIYEKGRYILNSSQSGKDYEAKIRALKDKIGISPQIHVLEKWFDEDWLRGLIEVLRKQKHGTAVILTDVKKEIERLCKSNRGILVEEDEGICRDGDEWDEKRLLGVTNIDGALFMDLEGICKAIGVIVDGEAKIKGDTGKGSRYNSIVNYVRQKAKDSVYLGIIVSEDGMIELTCNLEPDDDKSVIEK